MEGLRLVLGTFFLFLTLLLTFHEADSKSEFSFQEVHKPLSSKPRLLLWAGVLVLTVPPFSAVEDLKSQSLGRGSRRLAGATLEPTSFPLRGPDSEKTSEPGNAFTSSRDLTILGRSEWTESKSWGRGEPCEASCVLSYGQKFLFVYFLPVTYLDSLISCTGPDSLCPRALA